MNVRAPNGQNNTGVGGHCYAGHECPMGTASPVPCLAGFYSGYTQRASCDVCPPGNKTDREVVGVVMMVVVVVVMMVVMKVVVVEVVMMMMMIVVFNCGITDANGGDGGIHSGYIQRASCDVCPPGNKTDGVVVVMMVVMKVVVVEVVFSGDNNDVDSGVNDGTLGELAVMSAHQVTKQIGRWWW